ncbi:unnamed protein product, partial [Choristocarpus tenellus]
MKFKSGQSIPWSRIPYSTWNHAYLGPEYEFQVRTICSLVQNTIFNLEPSVPWSGIPHSLTQHSIFSTESKNVSSLSMYFFIASLKKKKKCDKGRYKLTFGPFFSCLLGDGNPLFFCLVSSTPSFRVCLP